jgi:hypothetical protein
MNVRQAIDLGNYLHSHFPGLQGGVGGIVVNPKQRLDYGNCPLGASEDSSMSEETEETLQVAAFIPNLCMGGAETHFIHSSITPIVYSQKTVNLSIPLSWTGSLNALDRRTNEKPAETPIFSPGASMIQQLCFKHGVPIRLGDILKTAAIETMLPTRDKLTGSRWTNYQWMLSQGVAPRCLCHLGAAEVKKKLLADRDPLINFDYFYPHGVWFVDTKSSFPVGCGVKLNCVNFMTSDSAAQFYNGFLVTTPAAAPSTIVGALTPAVKLDAATVTTATPSTEKPKEKEIPKTSFGGPYHNLQWVSMFGGLDLTKKLIPHLPFALNQGFINIPGSLLAAGAVTTNPAFWVENRFLFIPNNHYMFRYLATLLSIYLSESLPIGVKQQQLFNRSFKHTFYQFVRFNTMSRDKKIKEEVATLASAGDGAATAMDIDTETSKVQALVGEIIEENKEKRKLTSTENDLHTYHGLLILQDDLAKYQAWFVEDQKRDICPKPASLEDVTFSIFRADTKNHEWITPGDVKKNTLDFNAVYSFETTAILFGSVFPIGLSCCRDVVPFELSPING